MAYATSFSSSLTQWYNNLLDKTVEQLDERDVCKMFRQNILPELAYEVAVKILSKNPFAAEFWAGDVLKATVEYMKKSEIQLERRNFKDIIDTANSLADEPIWNDAEEKEDFENCISYLASLL